MGIKKAAIQAAPKKVRGLGAWRNLIDKAGKHLVLELYPEVQADVVPWLSQRENLSNVGVVYINLNPLSIGPNGGKMWITYMFNIHLIVVGKFKEKYWTEAEAEYRKRLMPYAKISVIELADLAFKNQADQERIRAAEAAKISAAIPKNAFVIALTETGQEFDSIKFASWLETLSQSGQPIAFVIGGPLGLDRDFLKNVNATLSLSALTFPHQLARVVLFEQLYRAATISLGKQYHY